MRIMESKRGRVVLSAGLGIAGAAAVLLTLAEPIVEHAVGFAAGPQASMQALKGFGRPGEVLIFTVTAPPSDCPLMIYGVWENAGKPILPKSSVTGHLAAGQSRGVVRAAIPADAPTGTLRYTYRAAQLCGQGDWTVGPPGPPILINVQ